MRDPGASVKPAASARKRAAMRTAWIVGGIAVFVYVAFLLSGVFGR